MDVRKHICQSLYMKEILLEAHLCQNGGHEEDGSGTSITTEHLIPPN